MPTMVTEIEEFTAELTVLLSAIRGNRAALVSQERLRNRIAAASKEWLQNISSRLREGTNVEDASLNSLDSTFEKLLELSMSPNRKTTYTSALKPLPKLIQKDLLIPLIKSKPSTPLIDGVAARVFPLIQTPEEKQYFDEAFHAARARCLKAATVMCWCAAVHRLREFVIKKGLDSFNQTSQRLKAINSGFYKRFNKSFNLTLENELQEVFDKDLIVVISGMVLLDLNQTLGLLRLFDVRNSAAHPSATVSDELGFASFVNDICNLILSNGKLS